MSHVRVGILAGAIVAVAVSTPWARADQRVTLSAQRVTLGCVDALLLLPDGRVLGGPDLILACATSEYEDDDLLVYRPADGTCLPLDVAIGDDLDPDAELVDHDTGMGDRLEAVLAAVYADDATPVVAVDADEGSFSVLEAGSLCGGGSGGGGGGGGNAPPVANPDVAATDDGEPVTVAVLANDSDPEGTSLTVTAVGPAAQGTTAFTANSVTYTPAAGFGGTDTFTYTIRDGGGATDTGSVTVTVTRVDRTPPVVTPPAGIDVAAVDAAGAPAAHAAIQAFLAGATANDDVDGAVPVAALAAPAVFPLGTTVVTFEAEDSAGNVGRATSTVTVRDRTPPVLTAPADRVAEANGNPSSTVDLGLATAVDGVDGAVAVANDAPAGFPLGRTLVTYRAADAAGNVAEATQAVTVVDTTPPSLQPPPDQDLVATGVLTPVTLGAPAAHDLFGPVAITHDAPDAFPIGETRVTWTATDRNGNVASATQVVWVRYGSVRFLPPLSPGQVYKAGRVIPVKVTVSFVDGRHVGGLAPVIGVVRLASGEPAGEPLEIEAVGAASGGDVLVDTGTHYQFNLDTSGIGSGWIRISVQPGPGSVPATIDVALK